mgnify:CR=1 FL=1
MSRPELLSAWLEAWGKEYPSSRGPKMDRYYPVSEFEVAIKDGKPIAAVGYGERAGYNFKGMSYTRPEYLNEGLWSRMFRDLSGKSIVGLAQKAEGFTQKDWESVYRRKGWTINPSDEELDEIFGEDRDESITEPFVDFYRNHPVNTWAVNNTNVGKWERIVRVEDKMGWENIIKRKIKCPACDKTFNTKEEHDRHHKKEHSIKKREWTPPPRKPVVTMIKKIEAYLKRNPQGMTFESIVKDNYSENPVIKRHLKTLKSKGKVVKVNHVRRGKKGAVIETKVWKWIGE